MTQELKLEVNFFTYLNVLILVIMKIICQESAKVQMRKS